MFCFTFDVFINFPFAILLNWLSIYIPIISQLNYFKTKKTCLPWITFSTKLLPPNISSSPSTGMDFKLNICLTLSSSSSEVASWIFSCYLLSQSRLYSLFLIIYNVDIVWKCYVCLILTNLRAIFNVGSGPVYCFSPKLVLEPLGFTLAWPFTLFIPCFLFNTCTMPVIWIICLVQVPIWEQLLLFRLCCLLFQHCCLGFFFLSLVLCAAV